MRYKLAVFDMDGTVLDTLDDLADAMNAALRETGMPERTREEVRKFVGNGAGELIRRAAPEGADDEALSALGEAFRARYYAHCADKTRPYDGIPGLLSALRAAGMKTAVVSNKPDKAVAKLAEDYFPRAFDIAVGERDGVRRKPAPDAVLEVMKRLGATAEETVYIGDSDVDCATAANAGTDFIGVCWGFRPREVLEESGAKVVCATADELLALILGGER